MSCQFVDVTLICILDLFCFFVSFYIKLTSFQHQLPTGEQLDYYFAHFSLVKSYIFKMHLFNVSFKSINIHSLATLLGTPC